MKNNNKENNQFIKNNNRAQKINNEKYNNKKYNNHEKNNYIMNKVNLLTILIGLFVFIGFAYYFFIIDKTDEKNDTSNLLRVVTSSQKESIKQMYKLDNFYMKSGFYNYSIISLDGEVLFSNINDYIKGSKVDVETEIGYDNAFSKIGNNLIRYSIPLVIDNHQEGIMIIDVPKEVVENKDNSIFIPLAIISGIIIILLIILNRFIKSDIILPIKQLHQSAKNILKGNYECKIIYDYDGEIGDFCHDFEAMRGELKVTKEREEKLKRNEKELLACISHDLKTPLSSISGYVEGIRDGIVKDEEGIKRYTNIILKKSKELSKLIDDILEQLKTDLNEMTIDKKEIYSDDYFMDVLSELSLDLAHYDMNLVVKGEIPRALIFIDTVRIHQVVNNIVSNSIKYSKVGGSIDFWIDDEVDRMTVNIKDYGSGISVEDIPFVFNKFYRGEKHRNTNIPGSGLGLSISKYIVESHGGVIRCSSSLEEGTMMSFTIGKL